MANLAYVNEDFSNSKSKKKVSLKNVFVDLSSKDYRYTFAYAALVFLYKGKKYNILSIVDPLTPELPIF